MTCDRVDSRLPGMYCTWYQLQNIQKDIPCYSMTHAGVCHTRSIYVSYFIWHTGIICMQAYSQPFWIHSEHGAPATSMHVPDSSTQPCVHHEMVIVEHVLEVRFKFTCYYEYKYLTAIWAFAITYAYITRIRVRRTDVLYSVVGILQYRNTVQCTPVVPVTLPRLAESCACVCMKRREDRFGVTRPEK